MATGITLCMIVKNEERFIEGCLKSVKSIVDQIIIVDTGSTDATLDLVRPFNPRIIHYTWRNDFAHARNVGLDAVQTPWILMLDADERIASRDLPTVVQATRRDCTGFELMWRNYGFSPTIAGWTVNSGEYEEGTGFPGYVQDPMFRLYRSHPGLRYEGVVHEHVTWKRFPGVRMEVIPAVIHHYGRALNAARLAEKGTMYLGLGYEKVRQFPDRWEPYYEIGIQLQEFDRHAEALPYLEKGLELASEPLSKGVLLFYIASARKRLGQPEQAIAALNHAISLGYDSASLRLTMGNILSSLGDFKSSSEQYRQAQRLEPRNPLVMLNHGLLLRDAGDLRGAELMFTSAIEANPSFSLPAIELAALFGARNRFGRAAKLLEGVLERDPMCKAARHGLAKLYIQQHRPDDAIGVLGSAPDDPVSEMLRGAAHLDLGDLDTARSIFENALKRDRTLVGARVNLARVYARAGDSSRATRHVMTAYEQTRDPALLEMVREFQSGALQPA